MMAKGKKKQGRPEWLRPWHITLFVTTLLGLFIALVNKPRGEIFVTNSWSYVPAEKWWLHAILVGLGITLGLHVGQWITVRLLSWLFGSGMILLVVGPFCIGMGILLVWLARTQESFDRTQEVLFGYVMGPGLFALGSFLLYNELSTRWDRRS